MKKLYLIRHAKSDWSNPKLDDFDRPLNKRGKHDAPFMGEILHNKVARPDLIISSPAYRARQTTLEIANKINYHNEIVFNEYIYEANLKTLIDITTYIENNYNTVFLIGHNPSLNLLANYFVNFDKNIPTSGILEIEFDCNSFQDINNKNANLISFDYPKKFS